MKEKNEHTFSFRSYAWKQFRKNRPAFWSFVLLCAMVFVALFASFIANDLPLYAKYRGKTFYPALSQHWLVQSLFGTSLLDSTQHPVTKVWEPLPIQETDWRELDLESVIWAPVPYSPQKTDLYNRDFTAPSDDQFFKSANGKLQKAEGHFRHRLGTDALGRDVLAGLIHGTKISLMVGIISMGIATLIGLLFGAMAGYYGDRRLKSTRLARYLFVLGVFLGYFYGFVARNENIIRSFENGFWSGMFSFFSGVIILLVFPLVLARLGRKFKWGWLGQEVNVPLDSLISRGIEIFNSMPRLLLIISISAVIEERSLWLVMVIIGLTSWTGIARFTRAEFLRIREQDYISAAQAMGFPEWRIIVKHALPNALAPVFVSVAFGIASAILIESGLSFLNIGVPDEAVTWGSMLNIGRTEPEAWWLIIFPGLAIFITITIYNLIGEGLRDALDPRLKK